MRDFAIEVGVSMSRYIVEVRVREAGDVADLLPVLAVVELPTGTMRLGVRTVSAGVDWALQHLQVWMRSNKQ